MTPNYSRVEHRSWMFAIGFLFICSKEFCVHAIGEASAVVSKAWKELKLLGAISGGNYIKKAEECRLNGDNINMIEFAQYAITTADQAPNIILFIGPVAVCVHDLGTGEKNTLIRSWLGLARALAYDVRALFCSILKNFCRFHLTRPATSSPYFIKG